MRGVEGWGRHLCGGSATAAQATFALTHPANPGEIALIIASAARSGRDGLRHGVGGAAARLVDCCVAQEREEDSGEPAREGHDGNPLAPSHRDPCGPVPQVRRARIVEAEHRDGGLDQQPANARASRRSVFTLRVRVAYMGAKFGSATMTAWPSASRHRATHSLSVEDSRRMRAGARPRPHRSVAAG